MVRNPSRVLKIPHRPRRSIFTKFHYSTVVWTFIGFVIGLFSLHVLVWVRPETFCDSVFHSEKDLQHLLLQRQQQQQHQLQKLLQRKKQDGRDFAKPQRQHPHPHPHHQQQQQQQQQQEQERGDEERSAGLAIVAVHVGETSPLSFSLSRNSWWQEEQRARRMKMGQLSRRGAGGGGPLPAPPPDPPATKPLFDHAIMHFVDSSFYRKKKRGFIPPLWSSGDEAAHRGEGGGSAKSTTANDLEESEVVVAMDGLVRSSVNEGFEKVLRLLVAANDSGIPMSEQGYIFVAGDALLDETVLYNLINYVQIKSMSNTTARNVSTNEQNVKRRLLFDGGDGGTGGQAAFGLSMTMAQTWDNGKNCTRHRRHHEAGTNVKDGNDCEFVEGIIVTRDKLDEFRRQRMAVNCSSGSDGQTGGCNTKQAGARFADGGTRGATSSHSYLEAASYVQCFFNSKVNTQRDIGHTCQWKESLGNRQMENLKLTDVISPQGPRPAFQELYLYFKQQHLRELVSRSAYLRSEVFATTKMVSFLTRGKSFRYDYQKQFDTWNRYWSRNQTAAVSESFLDEDTHWKFTNDRYIYTTHNIHKSPVQKLYFKGTLRLLEDSLNSLFYELNFMSPFLESVKFHHSYQHFSPLFGVWHFVNVVASTSNLMVSKNTTNATTTTNNNNNNNNNSNGRGRNMVAAVADRKVANMAFLTTEKFLQLQVTEFPNWSDQTIFSTSSSYSSSLTSEHISIIVPVAGRDDAFNRFTALLRPVLANDTNISFIFIIFIQARNDNKIMLIRRLQLEYPHVSFRSVNKRTTFSRAEALQIGVNLVERDDVILLFMDIDMVFTSSFLARVRQFTVRHRRAYFPIYFSQYISAEKCNPEYPTLCSPFHFRPDDGFWRFYGYGMASIYKSDFLSVGGYDVKIKGWGLEDLKMYEACINRNMEVFRAPDPGLVHIYHSKSCSPSLAANQYGMCQETKFSIYLHEHTSAELVYGEQELIDRAPPWK